jgi:hypothetical protein
MDQFREANAHGHNRRANEKGRQIKGIVIPGKNGKTRVRTFYDLAKVGVVGSNPIARSKNSKFFKGLPSSAGRPGARFSPA